jgi:hypothetical protein
MAESARGIASLERIEALLANPELYELAELIPPAEPSGGGRPRMYPDFMLVVYEALISVYGSARHVEAEISHPVVWEFIRKAVRDRHPDRAELQLPAKPMRRHHYLYGRSRYLAQPQVFAKLAELHRRSAAEQAVTIGLLDPDGSGSFTHPDSTRLLYGDGKVVTPLYKAKPGDIRVDKSTGEITDKRYEPDAALHFEGTGETAWGTKFVLMAARGPEEHSRVILDFEYVCEPGAEARTAIDCATRLAPEIPGAQALVYDTALRGVHHQTLLRDLGIMPINRVTAAKAGSKKARRDKKDHRQEKTVHIEDKVVSLPDGTTTTVRLYARGGAVGLGRLTDIGELEFVELRRIRTQRAQDKAGTFRWYNHYELPGGGTVVVRLHGSPEDEARRFNRAENVRPIAPTDPDFKDLFRQRNDAESINRALEDTMYLRRAHSVGRRRQLVNLLGYALVVNSLALHRHRRRGELPHAA